MMNFNINGGSYVARNTFGGSVLLHEFDTEYSRERKNGSYWAEKIHRDANFDKKCMKNLETMERRMKKS